MRKISKRKNREKRFVKVYPNPLVYGSILYMEVSVGIDESGTLTVYNNRGQLIKRYSVSEGTHTILWDGKDTNNTPCNSGIYILNIKTQLADVRYNITMVH